MFYSEVKSTDIASPSPSIEVINWDVLPIVEEEILNSSIYWPLQIRLSRGRRYYIGYGADEFI